MSNNVTATITLDAADKIVRDVVAQVRADMRGTTRYAAYVDAFGVTRETIAAHAAAIAAVVFPKDKPVQTVPRLDADGNPVRNDKGNIVKDRTRYGNAVQAAAKGLRGVLASPESVPTDYLAAVLKAVDAGVSHNIDAADILAAVSAHVDALLS